MGNTKDTGFLRNLISYDASGNIVLPANLTVTGSLLTSGGATYATQSYVTTQISNLVNAAPGALDTLNELAAALGNDANFSTTVTNSIATKLALSGGTLTGALNGTSAAFTGSLTAGGTAAAGNSHVFYNTANETSVLIKQTTAAVNATLALWNNFTTGDNSFIKFFTEGSATARGTITYNRTNDRLAFNGPAGGLSFTGVASFSSSITATSGTFTGDILTNGVLSLGGGNTLLSTDKPHFFRISGGGLGISANNEGTGNQPIYLYTSGSVRVTIAANGAATFSDNIDAGTFAANALNYIDGTNIPLSTKKFRAIQSRTNNDNGTVGLDLSNTQPTNGVYSPIISFSAISSGNVYNCTYAAIWGVKTTDEGSWAAGDLIFGTANPYGVTQRMRITAVGNIGIGTSTPQGGGGSTDRTLSINSGAGAASFLTGLVGDVKYSTLFTASSIVVLETNAAIPLAFNTNGIEAMRINSSRNLSLGGTDAGEKFNIVSGNQKFYTRQNVAGQYTYIGSEYSQGNGNNRAEIRFGIQSDTYTFLAFATASGGGTINEAVRLTSERNLTFNGTSVPSGLVQEVSGNTPLLGLDVNFRPSSFVNTSYPGAQVRVDMRSGQPPFSFLYRPGGTTTDSVLASVREDGIRLKNGGSSLSYYEEGSWTPQLFWSNGGQYNMNASNAGRYVRVGNLVHLQFQLMWGSFSGSYGGTLRVGGIPFTAGGSCRSAGVICANNSIVLSSGYTWLAMTLDPGNTSIYIIENAASGGYSHGPSVNSSGIVYSLTITYSTT